MKERPTGVIPPMTTPFRMAWRPAARGRAPVIAGIIVCTRHAQFLQGLPNSFSRAPMPEASPSQQAAIEKAVDGLGALDGRRTEAAE